MAGAIPIRLTDAEAALFERMKRDEIERFLMELDEHGWMMARAVLKELASRRQYPMNNRSSKPEDYPMNAVDPPHRSVEATNSNGAGASPSRVDRNDVERLCLH
jgi:hypothetical protein